MTDHAQLRPVHRHGPLATLRTVTALVLREMSSTYGRSPGGYLWSVLEPVAGIVLLSAIFSLALREPFLGTNFAIFYATGLLPYTLWSHVSSKVTASLTYSRQLLSYPRVTIVDALLARFLLNVLTQAVISAVILTGILAFYDTGTTLVLPRLLLGYAMAAALAAGIGTLNCFLQGMFPLWGRLWGVVTRPLMLVSGVIIMTESIPEPYRTWILWNPLVHAVGEVRSAFYHSYDAPYVSAAYVFGVSLATLAVGLLFLWRTHRDLLEA